MANIREVARLAGVSPATVSRVMNGTAKVDEEKRRRVLEAIEQTSFQPNELARSLFKKSSQIVGLILPNIENPYFSELARAVEDEAFRKGFRILLCNSNNDPEKEQVNISMLAQMKADGIILVTNCDRTGRKLADSELPVVVLDRHVLGGHHISFVEADHFKGGMLATQHLLDCGCRNIVCFRGPQSFSSGLLRYQGYQEICRKYGIAECCVDCDYSYEAGRRAAEEVIARFPNTDGIVASNDTAAISAYKVFHNHGIRVPEDIQMVGFDDISISSLMTPEITTIHQPITELGQKAVEIIAKYSERQEYNREIILDVQLVERQTTRRKQK